MVTPYLVLFASTWLLNGRKEDLVTGYVAEPAPHGPAKVSPVQVLHSSVSTEFKTIRDVFIIALTNARERIWIQSPYFVPDEPLSRPCARRPGRRGRALHDDRLPDKKSPLRGARLLHELLRAGVKVYLYTAGFLHAKTVTLDDQFSLIGTCNWDIRSFILHDEVVAVFYDEGTARHYAGRSSTTSRIAAR